jgi:hypothetical protein
VTFAPTAAISYGGTVTVNSNRTSGSNTIAASGTGTPATFFADDLETGGSEWSSQPPWGITTETAHSGTHVWSDSEGGRYGPNLNISLFSPSINLTGATNPQLTFWHRREFAPDGYDSGNVWVTADNGATYTFLQEYVGTDLGWSQATIDLASYAGVASLQVVFQFLSDAALNGDGWYIDDVVVANATAPPSFGKITPVNGATGQLKSPVLTWAASIGAISYEYCIDTTNNNACDSGSWVSAGTSSTQTVSLSAGTPYYWQVRALKGSAVTYADSGTWWSFTTGFGFTDDPLVAGVTVIRAVHSIELRTRIDALRSRFGLPAYLWTHSMLTGTAIRTIHITELRGALAAVYATRGLAAPTYTDSVLVPGVTPMKVAHIAELRAAIVAAERP